jgi:hypothetical protein
MKTLNFFPFYERYLEQREKTTTFRLNPTAYVPGERVCLTVGWSEQNAKAVHEAEIVAVYPKNITDLTNDDFEGESPDCKNPEATALVLGCIYRTIVSPERQIWVVKFKHL